MCVVCMCAYACEVHMWSMCMMYVHECACAMTMSMYCICYYSQHHNRLNKFSLKFFRVVRNFRKLVPLAVRTVHLPESRGCTPLVCSGCGNGAVCVLRLCRWKLSLETLSGSGKIHNLFKIVISSFTGEIQVAVWLYSSFSQTIRIFLSIASHSSKDRCPFPSPLWSSGISKHAAWFVNPQVCPHSFIFILGVVLNKVAKNTQSSDPGVDGFAEVN